MVTCKGKRQVGWRGKDVCKTSEHIFLHSSAFEFCKCVYKILKELKKKNYIPTNKFKVTFPFSYEECFFGK